MVVAQTYGIVSVLLNHTHMRGPNVARMWVFFKPFPISKAYIKYLIFANEISYNHIPLHSNKSSTFHSGLQNVEPKMKKKIFCKAIYWWRVCYQRGLPRLVFSLFHLMVL